jgi:hypothetical protein
MDWLQVITQGMSKEQIKVALMMSWRITLLGQALWLWGFLDPVGLPQPFAKVSVVAGLQSDVKSIVEGLQIDRIDRLEADIFIARRQQCVAIKLGTEEQKRQYGDRLNDLINKYKRITQMYPRVPGCDEV